MQISETKVELIDKLVGSRIRYYRIMNGINQSELAAAIGLTFQQVQKYEKGVNRIAPSRLVRVARFLGVRADEFFPTPDDIRSFELKGEMYFSQYARAGMDLATCYMAMPNKDIRNSFRALVKEMPATAAHISEPGHG